MMVCFQACICAIAIGKEFNPKKYCSKENTVWTIDSNYNKIVFRLLTKVMILYMSLTPIYV